MFYYACYNVWQDQRVFNIIVCSKKESISLNIIACVFEQVNCVC